MITCHVFGIKEDAFSISVLDRNNKITVKIVHSSGDEIELELACNMRNVYPKRGPILEAKRNRNRMKTTVESLTKRLPQILSD